jgi:pectate lyase-like protein
VQTIVGGSVGIQNSNQQVNFKNIYFQQCRTAFAATGGFTVLLQGATFDTCGLGVDVTTLGTLVLLDSHSTNSGTVVHFHDSSNDSGNRNSQILIQNLVHDSSNPIAVDDSGKTRLAATNYVDTWVFGNLIPGVYQSGKSLTTSRPGALLSNGKFFTKAAPTYAQYASDQIVNVKAVLGYPVMGDGRTDDSASLNTILRQNARNCKITYFPYGVYVVLNTLIIPPGSRIIGEAWSVITGSGVTFSDPHNPKPVVQVGSPGDVGVVEIQEMRFTVAQTSPGAKIVEVNVAGANPGDVGFWNCLITVGGTADTTISRTCTNQDPTNCMAAFVMMHLTKTSSTYIENVWGWTADHNMDDSTSPIIISTGRGLLVEATKGTWLPGTGFEHNWLYNYNFNQAQNVFAGMLQSETPYMQGSGAIKTVPAPWTVRPDYGDPDYSWCASGDQKCRTALATNVNGGSDVALYNSAAWAFFSGPWYGDYSKLCQGTCQTNMMRVANSPKNLIWYSISTRSADIVVLDGKTNPSMSNNPGGWGAIIQAYRQFAA